MKKLKLVLVSLCILATTLAILTEHSFYRTPRINKWKQLSWDDFKGIPIPFSGWGAVISSNIYLDFDSINKVHYAYSGQNDTESWVSKNLKESDYALTHEQYHFNLTEVHSRKLNQFIDANPGLKDSTYQSKLIDMRKELSKAQDSYDDDSEHGLNVELQHLWQFKIDSLLIAHASDNNQFINPYSGATFQYLGHLDPTIGIIEVMDASHSSVSLSIHGLRLVQNSFQYRNFDFEQLESSLVEFYSSNQIQVRDLSLINSHQEIKYRAILYDTLGNQIGIQDWIPNYPFLNSLSTNFEYSNSLDSIHYSKLSLSILNTFEITTDSTSWLREYRKNAPDVNVESLVPDFTHNPDSFECLVFTEESLRGIYSQPVLLNKDTVLISYNILDQPDSIIHEKILVVKDDIYLSSNSGNEIIYAIPMESLRNNENWLYMGYTLKKDTANECRTFYYQEIPVIESWFDKF